MSNHELLITYDINYLWQTHEASKVFEHLMGLGVKPNVRSYNLLVDAHLANRDVKSALAVIDDMVTALFFLKSNCNKYIVPAKHITLRTSNLLADGCWI